MYSGTWAHRDQVINIRNLRNPAVTSLRASPHAPTSCNALQRMGLGCVGRSLTYGQRGEGSVYFPKRKADTSQVPWIPNRPAYLFFKDNPGWVAAPPLVLAWESWGSKLILSKHLFRLACRLIPYPFLGYPTLWFSNPRPKMR